jgi:hypothetical protein
MTIENYKTSLRMCVEVLCTVDWHTTALTQENVVDLHTAWVEALNPLTPELNPSAQSFLPRFLLGILIFKRLIA